MVSSFDSKSLFRAVASSLKVLSLRAAGVKRFYRRSCVFSPMALNTGTCFAAGTLFAEEKNWTHCTYEETESFSGSNSDIFLIHMVLVILVSLYPTFVANVVSGG